MKTAIQFGATVRWYRNNLGETLPAVAARAKISKGLLSRIENGLGNPCLTTITALARALYVKPSDLLP